MLTRENQSLAVRDGQLPGLRIVLDPERLAEYWSTEFGSDQTEAAKLDYVRYKPGRRCVAMHQMKSGEKLHQLVATAHNDESWRKHLRTFDRRTCDFDPHRNDEMSSAWISIGIFPCDRKLKRLQEMGSKELAENFVRSFVDRQVDSDAFSYRCVSYKPARRAVYDVRTTTDRRCALKFFDKASFDPAHQRCLCWDRTRQRLLVHGVEIPELVRANSRRHIAVTQWLHGFNLAAAMTMNHLPLSIFQRVGTALGELHNNGPRDLPSNVPSQRPLPDLADDVGFLVPRIHCAARVYAKEIESALSRTDSITTSIHGDFYAKQLCVAEDSIGILDFDQSCIGDPLRDVGNFIAKIVWNSFRGDFDTGHVEAIEAAFLDGYQSARGDQKQGDVELHVAAGLFRCVMHPFRGGSQEWTNQTSEVMRLVGERFDRHRKHYPTWESTSHGKLSMPPALGVPSTYSDAKQRPLQNSSIRWIADVLKPDFARAVLARSCPRLAVFGERLQVESAELIRYKAGRRCLVRYDLRVAQSQSPNLAFSVVGKTRFKGVDRHAYQTQAELWHAGLNESNDRGVAVPRPLGIDSTTRTWFQEFAPGKTLEEMMESPSNLLPKLGAQTAVALKTLHGTFIGRARRHHTAETEVRSLLDRLDAVAHSNSAFAEAIIRVKRNAIRIGEMLDSTATCGIHRDFYPAQVLATDEHVHVVDFDLYCSGPADLDAGNYLGHLWELSIRAPENASVWQSVATQFTDHFCENRGGPARRQQLECWAWLTLARHIWISTRIPNRSQTTPALIDTVLKKSLSWRSDIHV